MSKKVYCGVTGAAYVEMCALLWHSLQFKELKVILETTVFKQRYTKTDFIILIHLFWEICYFVLLPSFRQED